MSLNLIIGGITLSFTDEKGNYLTMRKADHYKGKKPDTWKSGDFYLLVPDECMDVRPIFSGVADKILVSNDPAEAPTSFINIQANGMAYELTLHIVGIQDLDDEAWSSGIELDRSLDIHLFTPVSWWKLLWHKPSYDEIADRWCAFEIEGVMVTTPSMPSDWSGVDGPDRSGENPGLFED